jgi:hypothetical protein
MCAILLCGQMVTRSRCLPQEVRMDVGVNDVELVFALFESTPRAQAAVRTFTSRWADAQDHGVSVGTLLRGASGEVICGIEPDAPRESGAAQFLEVLGGVLADDVRELTPGSARFTRAFGVTQDDLSRLGAELDAGHVVVVVVVPGNLADDVIVDLARLGGRTEIRVGSLAAEPSEALALD